MAIVAGTSSSSSLFDLFDAGHIVGLLLSEPIIPDFLDGVQKGGNVSFELYDEVCDKLHNLHKRFDLLEVHVYFVAISLMDQFLARIKVDAKHLLVVGVACYGIAAESWAATATDCCPSVGDLARCCDFAFTGADIARMQALVRDRLALALAGGGASAHLCATATPAVFHREITAAVARLFPVHALPATLLVEGAKHYELLNFRGSTMALAAVLHSLEGILGGAAAFDALSSLFALFAVSGREVVACREMLMRYCRSSQPAPAAASC